MRFLQALAWGSALFLVQVAYAASVQQSVMTPKATQIALQTFAEVAGSPKGAFWLAYYICLGVGLHAALIFWGAAAHARLTELAPKTNGVRGLKLLVVLLLLLAVSMVTASYFPNSSIRPVWSGGLAKWSGLFIVVALFAVVCSTPRRLGIIGVVVLLMAGARLYQLQDSKHDRAAPDVIIIGIDSLRRDHLHLEVDGSPLIPVISAQAASGAQFDRAFTPMARTYVAYVSVLTGKYPVNHGARENLYPKERLDRTWLLPEFLASKGYEPVLALDESRFANLDAGFGFQRFAVPPSGGVDFLVAGAMDSLATNFIQMFPYGWRILPHVAANRAGHTSYSPEVHSRRVMAEVRAVSGRRPLFLLSHYCTAHSPFWEGDVGGVSGTLPEYAAALKVVDNQVGDLLKGLARAGRLKNSIVVIMSDHGEALGLDADAVEGVDGVARSYFGHGYPVYDLAQAHVVLSIQQYKDGVPNLSPSNYQSVVSLVDLAPTLMDMLGAEVTASFDGRPLLAGGHLTGESSPVYVESGMHGPSLQARKIDPAAVVEEFAGMYDLTGDGRLVVNEGTISYFSALKQRMVISDDSIYVWIPGCGEKDCAYEFDAARKRLGPVKDVAAASRALCQLYRAEIQGYCGAGNNGIATGMR